MTFQEVKAWVESLPVFVSEDNWVILEQCTLAFSRTEKWELWTIILHKTLN